MSGVDRNAHDHGETKSFKWQGHRISGFDVPRWQLVRAAAQANCLDGQSRLSGTSVHTNGGKGQHAVGKPMGKSWRKKKGELKKEKRSWSMVFLFGSLSSRRRCYIFPQNRNFLIAVTKAFRCTFSLHSFSPFLQPHRNATDRRICVYIYREKHNLLIGGQFTTPAL